VIDLRWLAPLAEDALLSAVASCGRILIVDECRITGSQSEALMALFAERAPDKKVARIAADDSFIPLARAATYTLPSRDSIAAAARSLLAE
jgi:2-oxoisovalerate dehydrogenase E1 component